MPFEPYKMMLIREGEAREVVVSPVLQATNVAVDGSEQQIYSSTTTVFTDTNSRARQMGGGKFIDELTGEEWFVPTSS